MILSNFKLKLKLKNLIKKFDYKLRVSLIYIFLNLFISFFK